VLAGLEDDLLARQERLSQLVHGLSLGWAASGRVATSGMIAVRVPARQAAVARLRQAVRHLLGIGERFLRT
jgi:hypothetical protein